MGNEKSKPLLYHSNISYHPLNNQIDVSVKNTFVSLNSTKAEVKLIRGIENKQFTNKTPYHTRDATKKQLNIENENRTTLQTFIDVMIMSFGHEYRMNLQHCYWSNENLF